MSHVSNKRNLIRNNLGLWNTCNVKRCAAMKWNSCSCAWPLEWNVQQYWPRMNGNVARTSWHGLFMAIIASVAAAASHANNQRRWTRHSQVLGNVWAENRHTSMNSCPLWLAFAKVSAETLNKTTWQCEMSNKWTLHDKNFPCGGYSEAF